MIKLPYLLTTVVNPLEGGSVIGAGKYYPDNEVAIKAVPAIGYEFVNWSATSGNISDMDEEETSFTMPEEDVTLTAYFTLKEYGIEVNAHPSGGGEVAGADTYTHGDSITVEATANTGYELVNWTEDGVEVSTAAAYTFTAEDNRSLTANFQLQEFDVVVAAHPSAGGSVSGSGKYDHGDTVTLEAIPSTGYEFAYWEDGGSIVSTDEIYSFTATVSRNLKAYFWQADEVNKGMAELPEKISFTESGVTVNIDSKETFYALGVSRYPTDSLKGSPEDMKEARIYLTVNRSSNLADARVRIEVSYDLKDFPEGIIEGNGKNYLLKE